ncbi:MAG: nuclear transport factor 2 family protein [Phycisphaerales bacterium]
MLDYISSGRILEAMTEFYHDDAAMQENTKPPTVGLDANIEREKQFLANVKEFKGFNAKAVGVDGDTALVESVLEFIAQDGAEVSLQQVSVQRWRDGKIAHERFYYDSAG